MTVQGYTSNDILNLSRYVVGAGINHNDIDLGTGVAGALIFEGGIKGGSWLLKNKSKIKEDGFSKTLKNTLKATSELEQSLKGKNIWETSKNFYKYNTLNELSQKYQAFKKLPLAEEAKLTGNARLKYLQQLSKSKYYDEVRKLLHEAKSLTGNAYKLKMKEISKAIAEAELNVHKAKIAGELAPLTKTGKGLQTVKKYTGITKGSTKLKELAASSSKFRTVSKAVKGNAIFAGISLLAAAPEICETYNKLGTEAGNKQVGRTVVNIAAETAGFAIGMKAGAAAGAAIGSCIPIPGVGTAVGAVVGAAVGFIGSWLAGKASRAVVGESELQNNNEYNAKVVSLKAKFDKDFQKELLLAAQTKLKNEADLNSEDIQSTINSYKKVAEAYT